MDIKNDYDIKYDDTIMNFGDTTKLESLLQKIECHKIIKLGFIGGSITEGSLASSKDNTYVHKFCDWFSNNFKHNRFECINAAIGATDSHFGVARVDNDLLNYDPDLVVIEFSVNDENTSHYQETYEGLIRRIIKRRPQIPVILFHNAEYYTHDSAEDIHLTLGRYYDLPCLSLKPLLNSYFKTTDSVNKLTVDGLHPNDTGMRVLSNILINFMHKVIEYHPRKALDRTLVENEYDIEKTSLKSALTKNRYENAIIYNQKNIRPFYSDFELMELEKEDVTDVFKQGWCSKAKGAKIKFSFSGRNIAVQYRKTINKPAPIARYIIDNDTNLSGHLDANFNETWGDKLYIQNLIENLPEKEHQLEIEIVKDSDENDSLFELIGFIVC